MRHGPVIAQGDKFVFAQNLRDVAKFLGLPAPNYQPLTPAQLVRKWVLVLRTAQRFMRQVPKERMNERMIYNRDRSIQLVGHHIFRLGEAFLETTIDGAEYHKLLASIPPLDGECTTGGEIASYGETVIARLQQWWDGLDDKSCQRKVSTYYGMQPIHLLFERSTWHSAQHTRQMAVVLERFGIAPDGPFTAADLAGLPLPEGLWE